MTDDRRPGSLSCPSVDAPPIEQVIAAGRELARDLETTAVIGHEAVLSPEQARACARFIRMGIDVEVQWASRAERIRAEKTNGRKSGLPSAVILALALWVCLAVAREATDLIRWLF